MKKLVNVKRLVITIWICLWAVLLSLTVLKLCFNIWYPIIVESSWYINICTFIDNHVILRYIIMYLFYILSANIIILTCIKRMWYDKPMHAIITNVLLTTCYIIKMFNQTIGFMLELTMLLAYPIYLNYKHCTFMPKCANILFPICIYGIMNIWQMNIIFVKGLCSILNTLSPIIFITIQLDYYIFLIITWIGVNYFMGLLSLGWWFNRQITKYRSYIEREESKENPDVAFIEECKAEIVKLETALKEHNEQTEA